MAREDGPSILGVTVVAAAIGAVAALLLAPQSGAETRHEIRERANRLKRRATEGVDAAKEFAADAGERIHDTFQDVTEDAKTVASTTKRAAQHAAGSVKDAAADVETKARSAWGRATKE